MEYSPVPQLMIFVLVCFICDANHAPCPLYSMHLRINHCPNSAIRRFLPESLMVFKRLLEEGNGAAGETGGGGNRTLGGETTSTGASGGGRGARPLRRLRNEE